MLCRIKHDHLMNFKITRRLISNSKRDRCRVKQTDVCVVVLAYECCLRAVKRLCV